MTIEQILSWADEHQQRTGGWPKRNSGTVVDHPDEIWANVDQALVKGLRGLPGGISLAQLLTKERGAKNRMALPPLSIEQILTWADGHHELTGKWPNKNTGPVKDSLGETWSGINSALIGGIRGLPTGFSLARLLQEKRGVRNKQDLPTLTLEAILRLADEHHERTSEWPRANTGSVTEAPSETWKAIDMALKQGLRGLPGGSSLPQLLAEKRGVRNRMDAAPLTIDMILAWADTHHQNKGGWPRVKSGPVHGVSGETWCGIEEALRDGRRGLPGGSTLAKLLAERRGLRNRKGLPRLSVDTILAWADTHHSLRGEWPNQKSGPVQGAGGESWSGINKALHAGLRGLPPGNSLVKLLAEHRGRKNLSDLPSLSIEKILGWADNYKERNGKWPIVKAGPIEGTEGETWSAINAALETGGRGLPGGSSLKRLIEEHRKGK
jgi:hypothetical protein